MIHPFQPRRSKATKSTITAKTTKTVKAAHCYCELTVMRGSNLNDRDLLRSSLGHILLVDDREDDRNLLCRRLKRNGFSVVPAAGGVEALRFIEQELPDVVLLDIHMPDLDGFSVLQKIRTNYSHVQLPVMMLTVRNETQDMLRAFQSGANDYLTHFMDFPLIVARICTQVAIKEAAASLGQR